MFLFFFSVYWFVKEPIIVVIMFIGCYTLPVLHEDWNMQIWSNMQVRPPTSRRSDGHGKLAGGLVFCCWWNERKWRCLNWFRTAAVELNIVQLIWTSFSTECFWLYQLDVHEIFVWPGPEPCGVFELCWYLACFWLLTVNFFYWLWPVIFLLMIRLVWMCWNFGIFNIISHVWVPWSMFWRSWDPSNNGGSSCCRISLLMSIGRLKWRMVVRRLKWRTWGWKSDCVWTKK